jgi:carboxylesterase type B
MVGASINYRLGLLGFLGGPTVDGANDIDLNVGLLDQRAGLEWIQRHISQFGGDPDDVTIYGESAGGASMVMQVTAYGGKKVALICKVKVDSLSTDVGTKPVPFKRVVAESIGFGPTLTNAQIEEYTGKTLSFDDFIY